MCCCAASDGCNQRDDGRRQTCAAVLGRGRHRQLESIANQEAHFVQLRSERMQTARGPLAEEVGTHPSARFIGIGKVCGTRAFDGIRVCFCQVPSIL